MHRIYDYVCNELEDLERKVERDGSLTMNEIQYADTLMRIKKNCLKTEQMSDDGESGYSRARGRRRDSRGRYADSESMVERIRDMMHDAPDDATRMEFQRFIDKIDRR